MSIFKWFTNLFKKPSHSAPIVEQNVNDVKIPEQPLKTAEGLNSARSELIKLLHKLATSYSVYDYKAEEFIDCEPPLPEVTPEKQLEYDNYAKWYRTKATNYYKHCTDLNGLSPEEKQYAQTTWEEVFNDGEILYTIIDGVRYDFNKHFKPTSNALFPARLQLGVGGEHLYPFRKFDEIHNKKSNLEQIHYGEPIWFTAKGKAAVDRLAKIKSEKSVKLIKTKKKIIKKK